MWTGESSKLSTSQQTPAIAYSLRNTGYRCRYVDPNYFHNPLLYIVSSINANFMDSYQVLENLNVMSKITEEKKNTFLFLSNDTTHEPTLLQMPGFTPAMEVDNSAYPIDSARYTIDGTTLKLETEEHISHYHANIAAYKMLGQWFDHLRKEGVYDNTRIILVADHGKGLNHLEDANFGFVKGMLDNIEYYYPMLMVKDFDAEGFTVSDVFMTNADVATLALEGVVENPVNPFTGKEINSDEKYAHDQYIIISGKWQIEENNGNTFAPGQWASIGGGKVTDSASWTNVGEGLTLKEHAAP